MYLNDECLDKPTPITQCQNKTKSYNTYWYALSKLGQGKIRMISPSPLFHATNMVKKWY